LQSTAGRKELKLIGILAHKNIMGQGKNRQDEPACNIDEPTLSHKLSCDLSKNVPCQFMLFLAVYA
jgi:hypothetical protein